MKDYQSKTQQIINSIGVVNKIRIKKGYGLSTSASKIAFITELRHRYLNWQNKIRKGYNTALVRPNDHKLKRATIERNKIKLKNEYIEYEATLEKNYRQEKAKFTKKYKPVKLTLTDKIQKIVLTGFGGFVIALEIGFSIEVLLLILHPIVETKRVLWMFGLIDKFPRVKWHWEYSDMSDEERNRIDRKAEEKQKQIYEERQQEQQHRNKW